MIKFNKVTKTYGDVTALKDVSFEVKDGEFVFLMGPSGAGKTTILKLILAEISPDSGEIHFGTADVIKVSQKDLPKLRQRIGCVFQDFKLLNERTAYENIEIALAVLGVPEAKWKERVDKVLKMVGLSDRKNLFPSQLSGGEIQRVSLARALVVNPDLILADEPTGNLDWEKADEIMELLEKVNAEGKTIIVATHNEEIVAKLKKRVIKLASGKIIKE
ncbi:MAG: cell division ATP-binding protein FtsE [Candidatus Woesebacteria bacterium]|nr:cell division ATP-binding protein FtsE [Candidatus Woesebacteria bacterium]